MALDGPTPLSGVDNTRLLPVSPVAGRPTSPVSPVGAEENVFTPTVDLAQLLRNIRQTAEIRQEIVGEVAARLARGEFATATSVDATVQSILESNALQD